jgi:hypothetical protein
MNTTITGRAAMAVAGSLAVIVLGPIGTATAEDVWCEPAGQTGCTEPAQTLERPVITVEKKAVSDPEAMAEQHRQARMAFQLQGPPAVTTEQTTDPVEPEDPAAVAERHRQQRMAFVMQ